MSARKRKENESYKDYRESLKGEAMLLKRFLRGRFIWINKLKKEPGEMT